MVKASIKIKVFDSNGEEYTITEKDISSFDLDKGEIYRIYYEDRQESSTEAHKGSFEIIEFSILGL